MNFNHLYIYRITHIDNVPHILQYGITHNNSQNRNSAFTPIGDKSIINKRGQTMLFNGKMLGQYIPFYFGSHSPMLYVIQKGYNGVQMQRSHNIIYLVTSVQQIIDMQIPFVYSDGHATNSLTSFFNLANIANIENDLDFGAIKAKHWQNHPNDLDLKRRKESEFLIEFDLPFDCIQGILVDGEYAKRQLINLGVNRNMIHLKPEYYY
mgnify:CR=1 FL=1